MNSRGNGDTTAAEVTMLIQGTGTTLHLFLAVFHSAAKCPHFPRLPLCRIGTAAFLSSLSHSHSQSVSQMFAAPTRLRFFPRSQCSSHTSLAPLLIRYVTHDTSNRRRMPIIIDRHSRALDLEVFLTLVSSFGVCLEVERIQGEARAHSSFILGVLSHL